MIIIEKVLCAAIWVDDGKTNYLYQPKNIKSGFVISGWRHGSILEFMKAKKVSNKGSMQGFITSDNRFLDRVEARELVIKTGQLEDTAWNDELYSEDLY